MKLLTIALMLAALATADAATARDHGDRGRGPGAPGPRYHAAAAPGGGNRGPVGPGPGSSPWGGRSGYPEPHGYAAPPPYASGWRGVGPTGWGDYAPPAAGPARWRRGQFFPPSFRGEVVGDYQRYHLRRPPPGFYWYRSGDDFVLAAVSSGLIFEVVGGGY